VSTETYVHRSEGLLPRDVSSDRQDIRRKKQCDDLSRANTSWWNVITGDLIEPEHLLGAAQRVRQMRGARGDDRQRLRSGPTWHPEVQFGLPGG
jgi:hypothetical protein